MSPPRNNAPNSDQNDALLRRYAEANALDAARPGELLRHAVLTHAKTLAEASIAPPLNRSPAANNSPWKLRALGSLAVVGLVGLLVMQFERGSTEEQAVALGAPSVRANKAGPPGPANKSPDISASGVGDSVAPSTLEERGAMVAPPVVLEPDSPAPIVAPRPAAPAAKAEAPKVPDAPRAPNAVDRMAPMQRAAPAEAIEAPDTMARAAPPDEMGASRSTTAPAPAEAPVPMATVPSAPRERQAFGNSGNPVRPDIDTRQSSRAAQADATQAHLPPLHRAVALGNLQQLQNLLQQGANINARDDLGRTPLMIAAMGNTQALVEALMTAGADASLRDTAGLTAADHATRAGHADWLTLFAQPER